MIQSTNQIIPPSPQVLHLISEQSFQPTRDYLRKLMKQLKYPSDQNQVLLKQTMRSIASILKDPNVHPRIKYSSHRFIMYLLLLADLDVYDEFLQTVFLIIKVNCMYNKSQKIEVRGEDFFKKSKYYTETRVSAAQKNEIKNYGIQYIIFCLQTVYQLAKWLPFDLQEDTKPTKFSLTYDSLRRQGVQFPKEDNFKYYLNQNVDEIQRKIKQIQLQFESLLGNGNKSNSVKDLKVMSNLNAGGLVQQSKKLKGLQSKKNISGHSTSNIIAQQPNNRILDSLVQGGNRSNASVKLGSGNKAESSRLSNLVGQSNDLQNKNRIFMLEEQNNKLLKQIQIQRNFFQGQLEKQRKLHQQNIFKYEKKIAKLQQQIEKMRQKMTNLQSKNQKVVSYQNKSMGSSQGLKQKTIEQLQNRNKMLTLKLKQLQQDAKNNQIPKLNAGNSHLSGQNVSVMSIQLQKLKKQNISLKAKLLTEFSESSEFSTKKSHTRTQNSQKEPESLKFMGYEDARTCFQPFYSNSSSQIKIRLRKAILRQKQLLCKDQILQIGCIAKFQSPNSIRLIVVFTNISQKPLFNFAVDYVCRDDLTIKILQSAKNYLQISGQTKAQLLVSINQIDFRCLLCSVRFNIEEQNKKCALILPVSKLKLAQQLVYTPIKKADRLKKIQKLFVGDKKILPNLHKFKDYFQQSILQVDKTGHQVYHLKMLFMGVKLYLECDQIQGQHRIAIKYYEDDDYSRAQKLLQQMVFLLAKN